MGYYLAGSIYPPLSTFVKIIQETNTKKECVFAKAQEECRKEIKRSFDVLQARFAILWSPGRFSDNKSLQNHECMCDSTQHDHRG
jgi:hypothetical protein